MDKKEISAQIMTSESFSEFGTLLVPVKEKITFSNAFVNHYNDLGSLKDLGEDPVVSYFSTYRRNFIIDNLERHINTCEIFFPIYGTALMPFAPSFDDGTPDLDNMKVFVCIPGQPFIGGKGVWHLFPFPIGDRFEAYNIVEKRLIEDDLENYTLKETIRIVL